MHLGPRVDFRQEVKKTPETGQIFRAGRKQVGRVVRLPGQIDTVDRDRSVAALAAAREPEARARLTRLETARAAAEEVSVRGAELEGAFQADRTAAAANPVSSTAYSCGWALGSASSVSSGRP